MMGSEDELQALRRAIAVCRVCRDAPMRGEADRLPHEPRPVAVLSATARILIAGQAPGLRVHESGVPFDDASGDRLRQWLGVDRDSFYNADHFAILGIGFCFPGYSANGSDLPPRRECAPLWRQRAMDVMPQTRTRPDHRSICSGLASRLGANVIDDGNRFGMAALSPYQPVTRDFAPTASQLAQQRVAEAQSLVRGGVAARIAGARENPRFLKQVSFPPAKMRYRENIIRKGTRNGPS